MRFPFRLLLATLIASPASLLHAQAEPAPEQRAPDPDAQASSPTNDASSGEAQPQWAPEDQGLPPVNEPAGDELTPAADVDSARADSAVGGGEAGPPEWMFGTYCTRSMSGRSPISRATYRPDNIVEVRPDGREQSLFLHWHIIASETNRSESVVTVEISGDTPNRETVYFRIPRADLAARRYFRAVIEDRRQMGWDDFSRRCAPIAVP